MWVLQQHNFGLGNFINLSPAIQRLSERFNRPIDVYFDLPFVRDCFLDCPFINILEIRPQGEPMFSSSLTNKTINSKPDYQYIYEKVTLEKWDGRSCYVDQPSEVHAIKYAVFVHGSGNESQNYLDTKQIPQRYFELAIKKCWHNSIAPVFVGSPNDLKRNEWASIYAAGIGDVRRALSLINGAEFVVGNDTGLIHAAGAMDKKTFVFWKDTQLPRCQNSGTQCTYLMRDSWELIEGLV